MNIAICLWLVFFCNVDFSYTLRLYIAIKLFSPTFLANIWMISILTFFSLQCRFILINQKAIPPLCPGSFIMCVKNTAGLTCTTVIIFFPTVSFVFMIPKQQTIQTSLIDTVINFGCYVLKEIENIIFHYWSLFIVIFFQ